MVHTGEFMDGQKLNRAVLARQSLLERGDEYVPVMLEKMGGLQAQYAPSSYVGLWSRTAGLQRTDLDLALNDRSVIQGTLMRITIHLVSRNDYWLFAAGLRQARRQQWLRLAKDRTDAEMAALAERTRSVLASGPMKRTDLIAELGVDSSLWIGIGLWVDMVRVPPSGTWDHRRADLYGLAETWVGPEDATEEQGIDHLIRRYLAAFGPATVGDLASWSGFSLPVLAPRLAAMETASYRDTAGKELFDLPGAPLPDPQMPAPVRFLPTWDASLLVHCRRAGILPEEYRPRISHQEPPVGGHVPGRREGGRHLEEPEGPGADRSLRAAGCCGPAGAGRGDGALGSVCPLDCCLAALRLGCNHVERSDIRHCPRPGIGCDSSRNPPASGAGQTGNAGRGYRSRWCYHPSSARACSGRPVVVLDQALAEDGARSRRSS